MPEKGDFTATERKENKGKKRGNLGFKKSKTRRRKRVRDSKESILFARETVKKGGKVNLYMPK